MLLDKYIPYNPEGKLKVNYVFVEEVSKQLGRARTSCSQYEVLHHLLRQV